MEYGDKKIVRVALVVLFLSLFLIYISFFEQQKKQEKHVPPTTNQGIVESQTHKGEKENGEHTSVSLKDISSNVSSVGATGSEEGVMQDTSILSPTFVTGSFSLSGNDILQELEKSIKDLTGTTPSFKEPDVVKDLGLPYQYVLEDGSGVFYIYMGTGRFDYETEVKKLGGDVVIFRTELDIEKNNLPGEKVMFINIPGITYDKKPVLTRKRVYMVVRVGEDERVVQIPYEQYHKHKKTIRRIFTESYKRR